MLSVIVQLHNVYKGFCELKPKTLVIQNSISMRKCIPGFKEFNTIPQQVGDCLYNATKLHTFD